MGKFVQSAGLLVLAACYVLGSFGSQQFVNSYFGVSAAVAIGVYVLASGWTVIDAVLRFRRRDLAGLRTGTAAVKIAAVVFFVLNFVFAAAVTFIGTMFGGIAGPVVAVLWAAFTYMIMLPTAIYPITTLIRMLRDRQITVVFFVLSVLAQLVFVADVIGGVVIVVRATRALRAATQPAEAARTFSPPTRRPS